MRPLETLLTQFGTMTDADVFELHRIVSGEAQRRRQNDPVYQAHYEAGVQAGRAKWEREMAKVLPDRYGKAATDASR